MTHRGVVNTSVKSQYRVNTSQYESILMELETRAECEPAQQLDLLGFEAHLQHFFLFASVPRCKLDPLCIECAFLFVIGPDF